ncbi:RNA-binding protein [Geoglobus sp.]
MDTANDFRIKLAEKGVEELEKSLNNVKVQRRKELIKAVSGLKSEVQIVKYSYMPFEELAEFESTLKISETAESVLDAVMKAERDFHQLNSKYWLEYLVHLPDLLRRGQIERAYEAIRYFSGEIVSSVQLSDSLWLCSFDCGFKMEIVTNSTEFRAGRNAVVSFLPPRQFGEVVSEGMFVSAQLEKRGELDHSEILAIKDRLGEVEAAILSLL